MYRSTVLNIVTLFPNSKANRNLTTPVRAQKLEFEWQREPLHPVEEKVALHQQQWKGWSVKNCLHRKYKAVQFQSKPKDS